MSPRSRNSPTPAGGLNIVSAKRPSKRRANAKRHPFALAQLSAWIISLITVYTVALLIQLYLHNNTIAKNA